MKLSEYMIGPRRARLTCYLSDATEAVSGSSARPAVLILPGGGYEFVSDAEREPVAMAYAAQGMQAFTLAYSVGEDGAFPTPQREAIEAIAVIRAHAAEFCVDPSAIAVVGFSAGGHLAASTGVLWHRAELNPCADLASARPDALVLVYPCITTGEYAYPGLMKVHGRLTKTPELLSVERLVDERTPPAFLCHTAQDSCVPSLNALLFASALARYSVPYELHVYKEGPHGMSLANAAVSSPLLQRLDAQTAEQVRKIAARFSGWFELSVQFLRLTFMEKQSKSAPSLTG